VETLSPEIVEELRRGRATRERKIAVCSTGAHLPAADRAEILAILALDADEAIAERAKEAILALPIEYFVEALQRQEALEPLFDYAARNLAVKPVVCNALIDNKACDGDHLAPAARHFSTSNVQALMEDLERVSESPALAVALVNTTSVTAEQKHLLHELLSEAHIDEATLAEAAADAEPDAVKRQTLLQRLAKMTVSQRVQFAIKGGSEARRTLIRDSNKVVQRAVLQSPRLTDQEVEGFAAMTSLTDEILRLIANNRNFRKNYTVVRNLLNNPKTPLDVSLHMLPMINAIDLKRLCTNKNIPETLRTTAIKLQRQRSEFKKG
jgi:hypothetical protein